MVDDNAEHEALISVAIRLGINISDSMTSAEIARLIALHDRAERPTKEERRYWLGRINSEKDV
jgi:hypothetical protein